MPALFLVENVTPTFDVPDPMLDALQVSAYGDPSSRTSKPSKVLVQFPRGL